VSLPFSSERIRDYLRLMRVDRPIGTLLLLWPTLWALWLAGNGRPDPLVLAVFVAGVFLMRSAGCVINDYADRHIDPHVRRTRERPLAAGRVSPREALTLFAGLCLTAFGLVLLLDWKTVALSVVAVLLAAVYPFMKRVTHLPQVVLGAAFAWAIPMAFMAEQGQVPPLAWLLFLVTVAWTVAYDTWYAMVDRADDVQIGVKSTAILFGRHDRLIVGLLQAGVLAGLVLVGRVAGLGWPYWLALAVGAGLFAWQQWITREREEAACFRAFLNNNAFGAVIFAGIAGHYLLVE